MTEIEQRQLDEQGFLVLDGFMDLIAPDLLRNLRERLEALFQQEGDAAGSEFKQEAGCRRLANLVDKGEIFQQAFGDQRILAYIHHVLGPAIKLSSLNARSVDPHFDRPQPLHADMSAVADSRGFWVCNTVWLMDDFTADNGAIRAIPGSHRFGRLPADVLDDPTAHDPREVLLTGRAGSVLVMNAHLWHGGTGNRTGRTRTALHAFYCRRDKPQQQYQKQLVSPAVQQKLNPRLRELLALDDPENDRLSAGVVKRSGFLK